MAAQFPAEDLVRKYSGTTVLTTSRILNPISAVQEALDIYQLNNIQEPPRNTSFRMIWFLQKSKIITFRTFVIFKRSVPPELKNVHLWNCSILEDMIGGTQSDYLETKNSLKIAMFQVTSLENYFLSSSINCTPTIDKILLHDIIGKYVDKYREFSFCLLLIPCICISVI